MTKRSSDTDLIRDAEKLHEAGKLVDAALLYKQIAQQDPQNAEALFGWASVAYKRGNFKNAAGLLRRVLAIDPDHVKAQTRLGTILYEQGHYRRAGGAFMKAIKIDETYIPAYNNLAIVYIATGDPWKAVDICKQALEVDAENATVYATMAKGYHNRGDVREGIGVYERALALDPDNIETMVNIGVAYTDLGDAKNAQDYFAKALKKDPDFADAHYGMSGVRSYKKGDAHIKAMEVSLQKLVDAGDKGSVARVRMHFGLGYAYGQSGDVDRSFSHYAQGNYLVQAKCDYDAEGTARAFSSIKKMFKGDFKKQALAVRKDDPTPIFIVGMPRSGTTLVEQTLYKHPEVSACGELAYMDNAAKMCGVLQGDGQGDDAGQIPRDQLTAARDEYFYNASWHAEKGAKYFTDKMPLNFRYAGLVRMLFPQAKIIHCRRDPMDSCFSIYKCLFTGNFPFAYDLEALGDYYKHYEDLMAFWHKKLPGFIHDVQYEDMVGDQERVTRGILDFCGLEWDPACLDFHTGGRAVMTASSMQVKKPLYKKGVGQWKEYANHLILLEKSLDL